MLGRAGERLAAGYDFYAVFQVEEEYRVVVAGGKTLGTVPLDATFAPGQTIIFNGRRWRIESIDPRAKVLLVSPTTTALPPRFDGGGAAIHDEVVAAMRRCLAGAPVPAFLDPGARALLEQGRRAFRADGLDRCSILQVKRDCVIFPWVGSLKLETLALALLARRFQASPCGTRSRSVTALPTTCAQSCPRWRPRRRPTEKPSRASQPSRLVRSTIPTLRTPCSRRPQQPSDWTRHRYRPSPVASSPLVPDRSGFHRTVGSAPGHRSRERGCPGTR